jgi:ATP-dependent exoDNAse (exonuclease V) beta subunit
MTKPTHDTISQIVDEILSEMPLEERVSLANMKQKEVKVLQGVFDLYIRNRSDPEDEEYENIMHELWKRVQDTHRLRVVK